MEPLKPNCRYIVTKPGTGFPVGAELVYLGTSDSFDRFLGDHYITHYFLEGDIRVYTYETELDQLRLQPELYLQYVGEVNIEEEIARFQQQDPDKYKPKQRPHIP